MKVIKAGFNYSQDGPGNRLIFHLQGCNMQCPWCSNPEGMDLNGCMMMKSGGIQEKSYQEYTVQDMIQEAKECSPLFFDGGGVTVSGGEPTLQFAELKELLKGLHEMGIHTSIETNGTHKHIEDIFPFLDLMIVDLKHIDEKMHKAFTGLSNRQTKETLRKAFEFGQKVWIRTPLIGGFNDKKEYAEEFVRFYSQYNTQQAKFEMLLYHEYGKEKWKQCGKEYRMTNSFVDENIRSYYEKLYEENGLYVIRT